MSHAHTLQGYQQAFQLALQRYQEEHSAKDPVLQEAMDYMLLQTGKCLRPVLCLAFCQMYGGKIEDAMPFALAVEMIHCYSLIHDDLPAMDDDDLRRGKPSCHKAFDEATAILAGDALLTEAFVVASQANLAPGTVLLGVQALGKGCGKLGMVAGQALELHFSQPTVPAPSEATVLEIQRMKTGCLLGVSAYLGALAGGVDPQEEAIFWDFAQAFGCAFQLQDDLLDALGDQEKLGKPIGSDEKSGKRNYLTLFGLEKTAEKMSASTKQAQDILANLPHSDFLSWLLAQLCQRDH